MVSIHWPNRLRRSVIASSLELQITVGTSAIVHVRTDIAWMMWYPGVREVCVR